MLAKYSAYLALVIVVIVESSSALVYLMINTLMTFRLALSVSMILRVYIMHSRSLRVLGTLLGLSFAGIIVACVCLNSGIATQKKCILSSLVVVYHERCRIGSTISGTICSLYIWVLSVSSKVSLFLTNDQSRLPRSQRVNLQRIACVSTQHLPCYPPF